MINKFGAIEFSVKFIVRLILGFVLLFLFIGFLSGFKGIIPVFIIGIILLGIVIEVIWNIGV